MEQKFNTRYDCKECNRLFMASDVAMKVRCPHCNFLNVFKEEPEVVFPAWVAPEMPIYTLDEASKIARSTLDEDQDRVQGWEKLSVNYEGIETAYTKSIAANLNKELVYATKVSAHIQATISQIFECIWDPRGEMIWNTATVSKINVLEDSPSEQLVHYQLKKIAAINLQNDVVVRRSVIDLSPKQRWIYCVSEKTNPESQAGWVRGLVLFGGILIEAVNPKQCKVSWVWSFDVNKKLSVRVKDEEPKKVALRLCKLKKKIEDDIRLAARTKEYEAVKNIGFDN